MLLLVFGCIDSSLGLVHIPTQLKPRVPILVIGFFSIKKGLNLDIYNNNSKKTL